MPAARNPTKQDASHVGETENTLKVATLKNLRTNCFNCRDCEIGRTLIREDDRDLKPQVFARGNANAPIMLIGQNPGRTEIIQNKPFVGAAGKFLDKMIADVGLESKHLYVSNAVKCYTPGNRAPTDDELTNCRKFIKQEIDTIKPKLIVTLGNYALKTILGITGITKHRGKIKISEEFSCEVLPLLHPSSIAHNRTLYAPLMEEDLKTMKEIVQMYV